MDDKISIIRPIGLNRVQQRIIYEDGRRVRRCRGPHNPVYYFDRKDGLKPIDIASLDHSGKSKAGDFTNRFANVRTVGIRNDLKTSKFLGIRKDDDQEGNEQLEISLLSLRINNLEGSFIPGPMSIKLATIQDFGGFQIGSSRQGTRFYVPYSNGIDSFELKLFIHATGLTPRQHDLVNEFWFENSKGELFARFRQPDIFDSSGENTVWGESPKRVIDHALEPVDGGWIYTKYSTVPLSGLGLPVGSLIDGDIYYSTTADGYVRNYNDSWSLCRDAATGYSVDTSSTSIIIKTGGPSYYDIQRGFWYSDTSGVATPESGLWSLNSAGSNPVYLSVGKGTQEDTLTTADYDQHHTTEWSRTTAPADYIRFNGVLNPSDINISGITRWSGRTYTWDYLNTPPNYDQTSISVFTTNYDGTGSDPYLDITESTGWGGSFNGVSSPGSVNGIAAAGLGTGNGV